MVNLIKSSWQPCATCGDANGPHDNPRHVSPSRYDGEKLFDGMDSEEKSLWQENGSGQVCGKCRNRFRMRVHRAGRVAKGLTARVQPSRLWKGIK